MKRYTVLLDSNDDILWHVVSIPRGRVVKVSIGPPVEIYGTANGQYRVSFVGGALPGYSLLAELFGRTSHTMDVDDESNGKLYFQVTATGKATIILTLWYADETTKFQIMV